MKRYIRYIVVIFSLAFILSGCMDVKNTIISENKSPNNEYSAIIYSRDAGATTSKSYNLSIMKSGEKLKSTVGNTFHADSQFNVQWISDEKLLVNVYDSSKRIIYKLEKMGDIEIEYTN